MKKTILILFVASLSMNGVLAGKLYDKDGYPQTLEERRASDEATMWECLTIIGGPMAIFAIWFFRQQTKK